VCVCGFPVDDNIKLLSAKELLALPDELVALNRQALVLVHAELGVVVARIHVRFASLRLFGDELADVECRLMEQALLVVRIAGVDHGPVQLDLAGLEERTRSTIQLTVGRLGHSRTFRRPSFTTLDSIVRVSTASDAPEPL